MSNNGTRYTDEFKQQIVDLYKAGIIVACLSKEYSVAPVTIYKWIKELTSVKGSDNEEMGKLKTEIMQI